MLPACVLLASAGAGSCTRPATGAAGATPSARAGVGAIPVAVDNRGTADVAVYAVRGGLRRRLGTVPGTSRASLTVPDTFTSDLGPFMLRVEQVGGSANYTSDAVTGQPGIRLVLTIQPRLTASSLTIE